MSDGDGDGLAGQFLLAGQCRTHANPSSRPIPSLGHLEIRKQIPGPSISLLSFFCFSFSFSDRRRIVQPAGESGLGSIWPIGGTRFIPLQPRRAPLPQSSPRPLPKFGGLETIVDSSSHCASRLIVVRAEQPFRRHIGTAPTANSHRTHSLSFLSRAIVMSTRSIILHSVDVDSDDVDALTGNHFGFGSDYHPSEGLTVRSCSETSSMKCQWEKY